MSKSTFRTALEDAVNQRHSSAHPWSEAWSSGKLNRELLGEWVKQHYHYVSHFAEWLATVYGNCPHADVQRFLLENIAEEDGFAGTGDFAPARHPDLLLDFAEHCGKTREYITGAQERGELFAETLGLQSWCYHQAQRPFVEALSALLIGLESQVPKIYSKTTPSLIEKYGFTEDEVHFFSLHIVADVEHSKRGFEIVEKYATTPQVQANCVRMVREAAMMRGLYLDGVHRKYVLEPQARQRKAA